MLGEYEKNRYQKISIAHVNPHMAVVQADSRTLKSREGGKVQTRNITGAASSCVGKCDLSTIAGSWRRRRLSRVETRDHRSRREVALEVPSESGWRAAYRIDV